MSRNFSGFRGGKISPEMEEMQRAINEMVARQARARNDLIERVLLRSLTGTCGVLVENIAGEERVSIDARVPYATIVYAPGPVARLSDDLPRATPERLEALVRHVARKLAEVGAS